MGVRSVKRSLHAKFSAALLFIIPIEHFPYSLPAPCTSSPSPVLSLIGKSHQSQDSGIKFGSIFFINVPVGTST